MAGVCEHPWPASSGPVGISLQLPVLGRIGY